MKIKVILPVEVSIVNSTCTCKGIYGTDYVNLNCTNNLVERSVTIHDAVTN